MTKPKTKPRKKAVAKMAKAWIAVMRKENRIIAVNMRRTWGHPSPWQNCSEIRVAQAEIREVKGGSK